MFDNLGDLPLHPLLIHAAVIGIPLAGALAVLFAVPRTRSWARWPLALTVVGAAGATFAAKLSGQALQEALSIAPDSAAGRLIEQHAELADQLVWIVIAVMVLGVSTALLVPGARIADGSGPRAAAPAQLPGLSSQARRAVSLGLTVLLLIAVTLAVVWVVRVGDLGSRAVWNPTGQQNFAVPR